MNKESILIVEDEAIVAADLSAKLARLGYKVCGTTGRGEDAIDLARKQRPALVLLDIHLAGTMDGVSAAEIIRSEFDLPVIYLTAHSDRATLERAKLTEPFGYLLKPFDDLSLETHIEMALYKHRAEHKLRQAHEELELKVEERTSELQEAHELLKAERQRLYGVLETLPVYVVLMTQDYYVPFANSFFRERFGESGGKRCYEYLFNRTEPCEICESFSVLKTNAPHNWEWTGPDGRNYDIYDYPFVDADGSRMILEMGIDITERKQAERALTEANETLEQRVAERTAELSAANSSLRDSRRASLNLMEDAIAARRQAEETNAELRREVSERMRIEEALRESEKSVRRKLDSILAPEGDIGNLELADIIDAESMQTLMDNFYKLTQVPMGLIDINGKVLVGVGWQNICTRFHRVHPQTRTNCIESDSQLSAGVPQGEFKLYKCKNNLWDVATPVIVGGKHFGNFFMGQFFLEDEPVDYELFRSQARQYGFDENEYIAALESVPRFSKEFLDTGMTYFMKLAEMISITSYSNLKLARSLAERDTLMEALQKAHDELEQRVQQRTEELATTVETLLGEISTREQAEISLQRLNRLYAVLSETGLTIVRADNQQAIFSEICRIAVDHGGFRLAWIGLINPETGQVDKVASAGETGYLDGITISAKDEPLGRGPTGIVLRNGGFYICNNFHTDPCTGPWHVRAHSFGLKASATAAINIGDQVIGALMLYADEEDYFGSDMIELLQQIAADISFALDNLRREKLRRETEQALQEETLERLRTAEELREKEQLLIQQSRLAAMGEMINNIAHQWRQPLNTLGLTIQSLLLFYDMGDFKREFLKTSTDDAMKLIRHMSRTIDDFRNFFRSDKEKTVFSVNQAIQLTLSLIDTAFKNHNIEIVTSIEGEPLINGYYNEFSQALLNILQNASDVLVERKVAKGKVIISAAVENGRTVLTITDNAGGIPEELLVKIFEPYFSTKGLQGTGIGLFMSKNIIETNLGGSLTASNVPDGAQFRIEI